MEHCSFFAVVSAGRGRRSCRVVTAAPVPAAALVACSYGGPSLASTALPRSRYRRSLPVAFVGSLFPFLVSLFVPLYFRDMEIYGVVTGGDYQHYQMSSFNWVLWD